MSKIAIIEDDAAISQMYRIKFEAEGYTVDTAENGKLGLELIEKMKPDIILTNMGESEAPDTLKELSVLAFIVKANMTPRQVAELVKKHLG